MGNLQQTLQAAGTVDPALVALVARVARQVRHVASQLDPRVLENLQDVAVRVQDAFEVTPELEEQVLATATKVPGDRRPALAGGALARRAPTRRMQWDEEETDRLG